MAQHNALKTRTIDDGPDDDMKVATTEEESSPDSTVSSPDSNSSSDSGPAINNMLKLLANCQQKQLEEAKKSETRISTKLEESENRVTPAVGVLNQKVETVEAEITTMKDRLQKLENRDKDDGSSTAASTCSPTRNMGAWNTQTRNSVRSTLRSRGGYRQMYGRTEQDG